MITVLKPGLLTSIQDLGRHGYQKYGIIASGAMDQLSHRIANLLVGNQETEATMEITLLGPDIRFEKDALISLCGADLTPTINGLPIHLWRPILVKKGTRLMFGPCKHGCRTYLAVAGGFEVPEVMESKSTYLRAGIGGLHGRPLKSGDHLSFGTPSSLADTISRALKTKEKNSFFVEADWSAAIKSILQNQKNQPLRVMEGREFQLFSKGNQEKFFTERFTITNQSDRMGYRLEGPSLLLDQPSDMISEAVTFGTVQVPPSGQPIILLADRQTTGGYPKICQIATVDLPLVAQMKPGDFITFERISLAHAQLLYRRRENAMKQLKQGILYKFR